MGIVEMAKIRGTTEKYLEYLEQIKSISMYMISLVIISWKILNKIIKRQSKLKKISF